MTGPLVAKAKLDMELVSYADGRSQPLAVIVQHMLLVSWKKNVENDRRVLNSPGLAPGLR
jgi:hypothetical protein